MTQADAEVGDSAAAEQLAHHFLKNSTASNDNVATGLTWLRYAAELGELTAAALRDRALAAPVDHAAAQTLVTGRHGLEPNPALARRFHAIAVKQLQIDAEYGDAPAAYPVGLYALELPASQPNPAAAVRWLTYAAELGEPAAAEFLAKLYADGAPGIAPDAKQSARWTAFAKKAERDNFKPRAPLRK
jgi:TPR repeat protein